MVAIAYLYLDPLLEPLEQLDIWQPTVDQIYRDLGQRTELAKLLIACQVEPPQYLLLRSLEDLGDRGTEISDLLQQLEAWGIDVIAEAEQYQSSVWRLKDHALLKADLAQLWQQIDKHQQLNLLKRGHARNRLKTLPPPGKAPYGYRRGKDRFIVDKSTAPVVKDFFERFLIYGSLRGAVRYLEQKYGKKIAVSTGKKWLTNPVYRGDLRYKNREIISNTHTAILDRESAAQIDRLLRRHRTLPPRTASAARSLAGLVSCAECQQALVVSRVTQHRKQQEYLYLRCHTCPKKPKCKALNYNLVLEQAIALICQELPQAAAQLQQPNFKQIKQTIQQAIQQQQTTIQQLESLVTEQVLDSETALLRRYKIQGKISALENQLNQLPPENLNAIASTVSLPEFWFDLSESERRFYFREFIKQISVVRLENKQWKLRLQFVF